MTNEEMLLQNVLDHPDEDAPRLAYADYMDQIANPRGRFIRIGVELGRINGNFSDPNLLPLAETSHALLDQYGPALAGTVAELVDSYAFDRGFVELVELNARRFLELAPHVYQLAPIRHLDLTDIQPVTETLFSSAYLRPIRSLSLQNCNLTDREIEILAASSHLRELRWLSLADNAVHLRGVEALVLTRNLPLLRYVVFEGNQVNPSQQFGHDQGVITDFWMPEEGIQLEEKYGRIPWLRADPRTLSDLPPSRFAR